MGEDRLTVVMKLALLYLAFFLLTGFYSPSPINVEVSATLTPINRVSLHLEPVAELLEESRMIPLDRITAYNAVASQTDADPHISSCGPNLDKQIALSRDLFFDDAGRKHLCGVRATLITRDGRLFKNYVIYDTMNARYTQTADILFIDYEEAVAFGAKKGYLVIHDF